MKFFSGLFLLCLFAMMVQTVSAQSKTPQKIRVMTYNIMDGYDWGKDTVREKNAAEFIASEHPDVVALEELCGFTEAKLKAFAKKWGHNYAVILKENGYPVGITSDKPIIVKMKMIDEGLGHGMLHVITQGIDFFVVHLSPDYYQNRLKEAHLITTYMKYVLKREDSLYVVLGDFNSHSPFDAFLDKERPMLLKMYQRDDAKGENNLMYDQYDYSVIATFLSYPLVDVCERMVAAKDRFSYPTPILLGHYRKPGQLVPTRERIDYILTSPGLAKVCSFATIVNSGVVDKLSDHFPVITDFTLP